jgi:hypothetical protein
MYQHTVVLMKRIERLERSNRRIKLTGFLGFLAIFAMGAAAGIPHTFDVLNANTIIDQGIGVVDANGKLRVAIGANPATNSAGMTAFDLSGIGRMGVGIDDANASGASFADSSGSQRAAIVALSDNTALISTFEPEGPLGAYLFTSPGTDGLNGLFIDQPDGTQRANVFSSSSASFMQLLGPSAGGIGFFEPADGSGSGFTIIDSNLISRVTIADTESFTGNPFELVRITGPDGNDRALMQSGFGTNNGLVQTFDSTGAQTGELGIP